MTNYINEQMMEQMITKMEEVFAQMIVNIDAAIVRVFDRVMLDEKTIELEELKSTEKLHEVIEENVLSDLRKCSDESIEFNSFQSKEAVKIKPTEIRAAVVKDQIPLKESTKQLEEEGKLKVQSGHNPASKDRPALADQHHHEVTSKILNNVIFCEKVYSRGFMFENKLIMVHDPYGFRLLVMGKKNYGILEQILVEKLINIIKFLTIDAVEKANSDHSGLPKGCALMGHILYDEVMRYKSKNPYWFNCDRFVLSAGHSCMLKYDLLHLTSYDSVREDDLKNFRQWGSKTPGHPENFETPRVEVTTGLLDQNITNTIGLALAEKHLAARFNKPDNEIIDHYTYVIMGDGCQMEGISNEACSRAGHWGFWKLIAFYDDNHIFIDGDTEIAFTENVDKHFDGHRWHVTWVKKGNTGYDDIRSAIKEAKTVKDKPILIKVTTTIGFGSPNKANSYNVHGGALGAKEVDAIRKNLGWPYEPFHVPEDVKGVKLVVVTTEVLKPKGAFIAAKEKLGDGSQPVSTLSLDKRIVPKRIPFKHPSTFNTLAMDPVKKQPVMDDLRDFANDQSFYPKTGKAWKRGYLLDSPSRTGESNMIAAMAIYLSYNIYDLELSEFHNNSELRKLLMKTSSKSIIVIEDIDCSMNLTNKKKNNNKPSIRAYSDLEMRYGSSSIFCEDGENSITLSGLLNFIDELWSCCGSERIFVFTTNHIERLEPALLKSGRMDMHNYRSCCSYPEFWILLKNYLGYEESDLDGNVLKGLTKVVDKAKIRVQFKHVPSNLYKRNFGTDFDKATNELVLRVQPDEIIYLKNNNKVPGLGMRLDRTDLNLLFQARYPREIRDVYERLLLDAIAGERRLFIKSDEFSAAWSPFTPMLKELEEEKDCQELYLYGSRGLVGAHYLAAKYNV